MTRRRHPCRSSAMLCLPASCGRRGPGHRRPAAGLFRPDASCGGEAARRLSLGAGYASRADRRLSGRLEQSFRRTRRTGNLSHGRHRGDRLADPEPLQASALTDALDQYGSIGRRGRGGLLRLSVRAGEPAPDVPALRRLCGQRALLMFWKSWSRPCLTELQHLQRLHDAPMPGKSFWRSAMARTPRGCKRSLADMASDLA